MKCSTTEMTERWNKSYNMKRTAPKQLKIVSKKTKKVNDEMEFT